MDSTAKDSTAKLTEKQKRFCDEYKKTGNLTESYIRVYACKNRKAAEANSSRLIRNDKVVKYLQGLEIEMKAENIAEMEEINCFWTLIMRDVNMDIKDRLKASELRARVMGAFVERREVTLPPNVTITISDDE